MKIENIIKRWEDKLNSIAESIERKRKFIKELTESDSIQRNWEPVTATNQMTTTITRLQLLQKQKATIEEFLTDLRLLAEAEKDTGESDT